MTSGGHYEILWCGVLGGFGGLTRPHRPAIVCAQHDGDEARLLVAEELFEPFAELALVSKTDRVGDVRVSLVKWERYLGRGPFPR
jgi:hypothetical protein